MSSKKKSIFTLNAITHKDAIKKAMEQFGNDGHTVWKSEAWAETGLPTEFLERVTHTITSDGTYKGSVWDRDGNLIQECKGIYGLTALRAIAQDLGCEGSTALGRGFEARDLTEQIMQKLEA